ncbi:MAG: hypothetical protein F4Z60_12155 [Chloroflexi bacterium]|nr:hypothetical protein [Chloroflexota bacterium]
MALLLSDPAERARIADRLAATSEYEAAEDPASAGLAISDTPLPGARASFVLQRWVAITDQRRDVLDLSLDDVLGILRGDIRNWADLGGSAQPIRVYLPVSQALRIVDFFGAGAAVLGASLTLDEEVVDRVAATPGAFALVAPEELRLGVLALTVDGHDPYRDPATLSPLRRARWIRAPGPGEASALAVAAGLRVAPPFEPAGMLVTGELLPVRCSNFVLEYLDDYGAMFEGVRDAMTAADITVSSLESSLTDRGTPTPCLETYVLQGSPRAVEAMADAGIDVVFPIGNHIGDCWGGCASALVIRDTLDRLHDAGIATAGAGEDLAAARSPALLTVATARGAVRFAFLGYDSMAPWFQATEFSTGAAPLDAEGLREDIEAARELADHVVVGVNWGVEYKSNPNAFQREMAGIAMDAGAALVVGNHPHWVQAVEHFEGALVSYAGGNFVFDQDWSEETAQGMVIELGFTGERLIGYRIRPVVIRGDGGEVYWIYRPEFVDPAGEGRAVLDRIWDAQDRLPER